MSVETSRLTQALELGMNEEEYGKVLEILGREPSGTELAMYSVEWSEHCGYPRSRPLLRLLPKEGKYPTIAEEDAGGIGIGDGLYVVFKMESHNHPSQVEPKQGAATGIGGIIRDIFTMGARPVALLDSLRFGDLQTDLAKRLLHGVVDGIQFYGNCVGVPTVGGEIYFSPSYRDNCLVNVMCVGIAHEGQLATSKAKGAGNPVYVVGNRTGRDGIGGCSILASHEFSEDDQKRPTVQIGDPFTEKCLIEATLDMLASGAVVAIKDMGAAGITCSTAEMAAAGGMGMDVDLAKVPMREEGMEPWEIMMSESQERMLVVADHGREAEIEAIFEKWGLIAEKIGEVIDEQTMRVRFHGEVVAEVPCQSLASAPVYYLPAEPPAWLEALQGADITVTEPQDLNAALLALLSSPNIASKRWAFEQYDHMVQTNTVVPPGAGDAAVIRIKGSQKGLGLTADCNSRYCYLDPYLGAQIAVAEAARNLVCVGADPAAVTDCLNFGNPEKPDRFWQLKRAVEGIADACRALRVPVVSGNVSLYNEGPEAAVYPTPTIGMVGVLDQVEQHATMGFKKPGQSIALVGVTRPELGGSEYLAVIHGKEAGMPPALDLDAEVKVQNFVLAAIRRGLVASAHDCAEGGLAVTLAESAIAGGLGAAVNIAAVDGRADMALFAESQSRIILSFDPAQTDALSALADEMGADLQVIGTTGGDRLTITIDGAEQVSLPLEKVVEAHDTPIYAAMGAM